MAVVNVFIAMRLEKVNKEIMRRKDKRMNYTEEALSNIKTLKLYSWVDIFKEELQERRIYEFKAYFWIAVWLAFLFTSLEFFPNILSSVVLSTFIGTGHSIDLPTTFSVLIFFGMIQ
jgi:ABC-type bacteriocin/lantibiotic exporter with double-glycine peptidase domain